MRWTNIAGILALAGLASAAHRPGTYGDRINRQQKRWQQSARDAEAAAAEKQYSTKRATESKFLNANTTRTTPLRTYSHITVD